MIGHLDGNQVAGRGSAVLERRRNLPTRDVTRYPS